MGNDYPPDAIDVDHNDTVCATENVILTHDPIGNFLYLAEIWPDTGDHHSTRTFSYHNTETLCSQMLESVLEFTSRVGVHSVPATSRKLKLESGTFWEGIDRYPVEDWRYEVVNDDTRLGYWEWVAYHMTSVDDSEPRSDLSGLSPDDLLETLATSECRSVEELISSAVDSDSCLGICSSCGTAQYNINPATANGNCNYCAKPEVNSCLVLFALSKGGVR